tara:strand:- start:400 stop:1866 length:1467 start_codon:yes stop_codon:yes gene_type:complete
MNNNYDINYFYQKLKKKFTILLLILNSVFTNSEEFRFSGNIDLIYASRLSDFSTIRLPYRLVKIDIEQIKGHISLNGKFALEHYLRTDAAFLSSSDPQDFFIDMREIYLTYSAQKYELRVGKQIYSWGNVDENSPLDIVSPFDYYYMFYGGTNRKLSNLSLGIDYYLGKLKLYTVLSPIHSTNRLPIGEDDFPIELPIYPPPSSILPIKKNPFESGFFASYSTPVGDISAMFFRGYDRIFNLTGVNVYGHGSDFSFPHVDILFGFRKTNVFGFGGVFIYDRFTLRFDHGYFSTMDKNISIDRLSTFNPSYYDSLLSYPLNEKANYSQSVVQFDIQLPSDINFSTQYFVHNKVNYGSDSLPIQENINIPNLAIDLDQVTPEIIFVPGMGSPLALLTNSALIFRLDKLDFDGRLFLSITSLIDLKRYFNSSNNFGSLTELKLKYSITDSFKWILGITKVNAVKNHPDGDEYPFNQMQNFSHARFEIRYYF